MLHYVWLSFVVVFILSVVLHHLIYSPRNATSGACRPAEATRSRGGLVAAGSSLPITSSPIAPLSF